MVSCIAVLSESVVNDRVRYVERLTLHTLRLFRHLELVYDCYDFGARDADGLL